MESKGSASARTHGRVREREIPWAFDHYASGHLLAVEWRSGLCPLPDRVHVGEAPRLEILQAERDLDPRPGLLHQKSSRARVTPAGA